MTQIEEKDRLLATTKSVAGFEFHNRRLVAKVGQNAADAVAEFTSVFHTSSNAVATQTLIDAGALRAFEDEDVGMASTMTRFVELAPQSPLETMLISQLLCVNVAIGQSMRWALAQRTSHEERKMHVATATRLHRVFLAQVDALQKLRGKGQQTVTVQHVHVSDGGQAIVGHVEHRGGDNEN